MSQIGLVEKIDFLYIFNFNDEFFEDALDRLTYSILSIKDQNVSICISNNSKKCIYEYISTLIKNFRYIHKPHHGNFSRALCINYGVKNLVKTEYFLISDIDLIYPRDFIQRLLQKCNNLKRENELIRFICYNYNLKPNISYHKFYRCANRIPFIKNFKYFHPKATKHFYTHEYEILDQLEKEKGGYAHGNGLIHLESFHLIQGYDEEMIGYGPEDGLFNTRIGKINRLIYDNLQDTATFHLWHPRFHMIQFEENVKNWKDKISYYNSLKNPTYNDVIANKNSEKWGEI